MTGTMKTGAGLPQVKRWFLLIECSACLIKLQVLRRRVAAILAHEVARKSGAAAVSESRLAVKCLSGRVASTL